MIRESLGELTVPAPSNAAGLPQRARDPPRWLAGRGLAILNHDATIERAESVDAGGIP